MKKTTLIILLVGIAMVFFISKTHADSLYQNLSPTPDGTTGSGAKYFLFTAPRDVADTENMYAAFTIQKTSGSVSTGNLLISIGQNFGAGNEVWYYNMSSADATAINGGGVVSFDVPLTNFLSGVLTNGDSYKIFLGTDGSLGGAVYDYSYLGIAADNDSFSNTRIIATTPEGGVIATSTTFALALSGYINPTQYESESAATLTISNSAQTLTQCADVACAALAQGASEQSFTFPITASGYFNFSTTTSLLNAGLYTMQTSITNPTFSVLGFSIGQTTLSATTSSFTAGTTTTADKFVVAVNESVNNLFGLYSTSTCAILGGDFDLGDCFLSLIVPTGDAFAAYEQLPTTMESKFPFSYVVGAAATWNTLVASSTANLPTYSLNMHDLGIGSTTAIGNILPNFTGFSSSTVMQYFPQTLFDALKALASFALILGLIYDIFFTTRNMIRT